MSTILSFLSGRQITNNSGVPQSGARIYHYRENTTTPLTVWTDDGATIAHATPYVTCDAGGFVPLIYVDDTFDWKVVIKTSADVTLQTYDNLPKAETTASSSNFARILLPWQQVTSLASPVALTVNDIGNAYEADTTGGNIEFDLPDAASVGSDKGFVFKKTASANSMIIDPNGSQTIDDVSTSLTITLKDTVVGIFSNGAEWYKAFEVRADQAIGGVNGLTIANNSGTPTTQLDITASEAILVDSVGLGLRTGALSLTINAATTGANGLDTGALANNTWYYIWLISNGATTAALLSTSSTAPTMPSGYTFKYRIGAQKTGGSATFNRVLQKGNKASYVVVAASVTPNLPIIGSGAAGSVTVPTWVGITVSNASVPATAKEIIITTAHSSSSGSNVTLVAPNNAYGAHTSLTNPAPYQNSMQNDGGKHNIPASIVLESTQIFWAADNGTLAVVGWVDAVNAS